RSIRVAFIAFVAVGLTDGAMVSSRIKEKISPLEDQYTRLAAALEDSASQVKECDTMVASLKGRGESIERSINDMQKWVEQITNRAAQLARMLDTLERTNKLVATDSDGLRGDIMDLRIMVQELNNRLPNPPRDKPEILVSNAAVKDRGFTGVRYLLPITDQIFLWPVSVQENLVDISINSVRTGPTNGTVFLTDKLSERAATKFTNGGFRYEVTLDKVILPHTAVFSATRIKL
ncbi:MAG: hypothetical protein NT154_06980, partial [Verrucomicrobia bacterium]|nr:hypothetical protein [Verrucomicrobiota bacterium]